VLHDQHHGAVEVRIHEHGRGDQQATAERVHDSHIVTVRRRMLGVLAFGDSITNAGGLSRREPGPRGLRRRPGEQPEGRRTLCSRTFR
jgi:hypothetical protein